MSETGSLKVGFARQIINPPTGILTIGFGDRFKGNRGVHDDLTATAMVLALGDQQVGIVALDLLAVHEDFTRELENFCGIPLLLCCAHTHSAPMSFSSNPLRTKVKRYAETLRERLSWRSIKPGVNYNPPACFGVRETLISRLIAGSACQTGGLRLGST